MTVDLSIDGKDEGGIQTKLGIFGVGTIRPTPPNWSDPSILVSLKLI